MKVKEIAERIIALRTQRALFVDLCDHLGRLEVDKDPGNIEVVNNILLTEIKVRDKEISKLENAEVTDDKQKSKKKTKKSG
jgi:hypothetical protein